MVVYPGVTLLDAAGPAQVFSSADAAVMRSGAEPAYEIVLASPMAGDVETDTGIVLKTVSLQAAARKPIDTLIISGGVGVFDMLDEQRFLAWVGKMDGRCRRLATTCMGAFVTAKAGLLDGRSVSTHWRYTAKLQRQYPKADVRKDPLFIRDGNMWSAAGVTSGIDLALAMVEDDLGHRVAMEVAQALVVFFKRPGGQSQFSNVLSAQREDGDGTFSRLHSWIAEHLEKDLSVVALAEESGMSPRSFARVYKDRTGRTPAKSVEMIRVEAAKRLLEQGRIPLATIARRTGLTDEQRLRRAFLRHVGVSPSDYQQKFGS